MRHARGFTGMTLVEALITLSILTLAGTAFVALMVQSVSGWSSGTGKDTAASQATIAVQKLANEIRDGRTATVSEDKHTLTITFPLLITDSTTGEQTYDLSTSDPVTRSYYISNGNLVRYVGGQTSIVGRGISSAEFGASGGSVTINLLSSEQVGTKVSTQDVTGRVTLRNYRT